MSNQQQQQQQFNPDAVVGAALGVLNDVYTHVYFSKLAELGHVPTDENEALAMLKVGFDIDQIESEISQEENVYTKSAGALSALKGEAPEADLATAALAVDADDTIKTAAALLSDPAVYEAALLLRLAHQGQI
jgi:HEAT repeat protein